MSHDVYLSDPHTKVPITLPQPHYFRGGTYRKGGDDQAHLNVTYNYYRHYKNVLGEKGIREIYGLTGAESIPILIAAAGKLDGDIDPNYWRPTPGNAKRALMHLITLAQLCPYGVWTGD